MFIKLDYYAGNVKKRGVIFAVFGLIFLRNDYEEQWT